MHGGILEVQRAGRTERFDLTSHYTRIRTVGKPRSGRWRVLIDRPANTPFVIDRTMVDPKAFTRVLEAYHHVGLRRSGVLSAARAPLESVSRASSIARASSSARRVTSRISWARS